MTFYGVVGLWRESDGKWIVEFNALNHVIVMIDSPPVVTYENGKYDVEFPK